MPDVQKSKYFYRGRSQNWKTWKFHIFTPCARSHAYRHQTYVHFIISKTVSAVRADATEVPMPNTNPLAQTVCLLQGGKVHPNFEEKKFSQKISLSLHYDKKNTLNPLLKSVFKSVNNYGRYLQFCGKYKRTCNLSMWPPSLAFPIGRNAASTSRRVHWQRYLRPILRTGQHLPCASF